MFARASASCLEPRQVAPTAAGRMVQNRAQRDDNAAHQRGIAGAGP
jgi:hypothetical protein